MKKYYSIDLFKFLFSIVIAVFHLWIWYKTNPRGGFIGVEFFFLISGFFLMKQHEEKSMNFSPVQYTWMRIKKFYPHYILSFLVYFLLRNLSVHNSLKMIIKKFLYSASEIFLLQGTIVIDEHSVIYNAPTWYISALLFSGYILWALLNRNKSFVLTGGPIIVFWIYAYMAYTIGKANIWRTHVFEVLNYGILRAIAGMLLGILCYQMSRKMSAYTKEAPGNKHPTICMFGGAIIIMAAIVLSYKWFNRASFFYIVCFAVGVTLLTAGEECGASLPKSIQNLANWLGKISFAIYLNHYLFGWGLKTLFPNYRSGIIGLYLLLVIPYSVVTTILVKKLTIKAQKGLALIKERI